MSAFSFKVSRCEGYLFCDGLLRMGEVNVVSHISFTLDARTSPVLGCLLHCVCFYFASNCNFISFLFFSFLVNTSLAIYLGDLDRTSTCC